MNMRSIRHMGYLLGKGMQLVWHMIRGTHMLSGVRMPIITLFGGAEAQENDEDWKQAFSFAKRCALHNISVITGGGPGLMYAANCGAKEGATKGEKKMNTLGIAVRGVDDQFENKCSPLLWVNTFFLRKWLLIRYSVGFVVFPGGLGTVDELFELLNLKKHGRIPALPIVLMGSAYWAPMLAWMRDQAVQQGYMKEYYVDFFVLTDNLDNAFAHIKQVCDQYKK